MDKEAKKVTVVDDIAEKGNIKVKESKRARLDKGREEEVEDGVEKLYHNKEFDHLNKPAMARRGQVGLVIFLAIIFGLFSGIAGSIFILTRETIKIPFLEEIDLTRFFPTREITLMTEKKVTVTTDLRLSWLTKELAPRMVRIFKAKSVPEGERLPFLEQIYAPWQTKSLALIITSDGWLISGADFDEEEEYVILTDENKVFPVEEIIQDSLTKINFLKISAEDLAVVKFASIDGLTQGRQVIILDKFKKLHFTEISQPGARNIYKTDDLVRSTDRFSEFLRLDVETPVAIFPDVPIFGLDGSVIGIVSQGKIIPVWQFKSLITQVLRDKKITRSYLGIDYLRIEEAPGLVSPLFKDLTNGAIVYGPPVANSPAERGGIKNADIIVKADGLSLSANQNLTCLVQNKAVGEEIELTILRAGEEMNIVFEVGPSIF